MLRNYPKVATLHDGTQVTLRPMTRDDAPALLRFFNTLPREDRLFLRDDVTDEALIEKWVRKLNYKRVLPILAVVDEEIVGDATLHRSHHHWTRHVGAIRVVTAPSIRRKGLGTILAGELFKLALGLKLEKIVFMLAEDQKAARNVVKRLGFYQEAVLKGHIMDPEGNRQDLIMMAQDVRKLYQKLQDQIMDTYKDYSGD